ncbi:MAG TPA: MFS transporter [Roseiflexaceae bacterium]|nr:MFS transporter [Roseiflexaceae bacterium]
MSATTSRQFGLTGERPGTARDSQRDYWIVWSATLLFFSAFYALLVLLPRYLTSARLTDAQIGLVLGAFGVASLLGRPLAGSAADRWGQRRVMLWGSMALLIGIAGMPLASNISVLFLLRLLQTLGYVIFTTAGTALVVTLTPPDARRQRLAVFGAAANIAMTTAPALIIALLPYVTLATTFWLAGALALLAGSLTIAIGSHSPAEVPSQPWRWSVSPALRRAMLVSLCFGLGFGAFLQFIPLLAERRGVASAGVLYTCYGAGIIATRVLSQRWLGRAGAGQVLLVASLLLSVGLGWIAFAGTIGALAAALLIAAGCGLLHPTLLALHALLLPQAPGRATATFYIAFDLGIGVGSWLLGGVLEYAGFTALYLTAASIVLAGLAVVPGLIRSMHN